MFFSLNNLYLLNYRNIDGKKIDSEYEANLKTVIANEFIGTNLMGFAASAIPFYLKAMSEQEEAKNPSQVGFYGTVGDKIQTPVTVTATKTVKSGYGTSKMLSLQTAEGFTLIWFYSGQEKPVWNLNIGDKFVLKGTVKERRVFAGKKQTYITRGQIVSTE